MLKRLCCKALATLLPSIPITKENPSLGALSLSIGKKMISCRNTPYNTWNFNSDFEWEQDWSFTEEAI
jgi:hypothetical protein